MNITVSIFHAYESDQSVDIEHKAASISKLL